MKVRFLTRMNMFLVVLLGMLGFTNCGHFRRVEYSAPPEEPRPVPLYGVPYEEPIPEEKYGIPMPIDAPDVGQTEDAPLPPDEKGINK